MHVQQTCLLPCSPPKLPAVLGLQAAALAVVAAAGLRCTAPRRQEIVLIGIRINGKALHAALDACLCTDDEMAAAAAGQLADPFNEWPTLQQILDAGEDDDDEEDGEGSGQLSTVAEEGEEGGEEEAAGTGGFHPGVLHAVTYGAAELQECFDEAAQQLAGQAGAAAGAGAGPDPVLLGVVSWHADWCEPCHAAAGALRALAQRYSSSAAFFCLDVEASSANTALALEKVMRKPDSRRPGEAAAGGVRAGAVLP